MSKSTDLCYQFRIGERTKRGIFLLNIDRANRNWFGGQACARNSTSSVKVINEAVEWIRRTKNFGLDTMNESKNKPDAAGSKQETD